MHRYVAYRPYLPYLLSLRLLRLHRTNAREQEYTEDEASYHHINLDYLSFCSCFD
jgi:hypothetical protein